MSMYLSMANRKELYRRNERLSDETVLRTSNLNEVVESLSKALDTLESLKDAEIYQLLKVQSQYFPKNGIDLQKITRLYEKSLIEHALKLTKGKQTDAAKLLNLGLSTLHAKIKSHQIEI